MRSRPPPTGAGPASHAARGYARTRPLPLLLLTATLPAACSDGAAPRPVEVVVTVVDSAGAAAPGVRVTLSPSLGRPVSETTDSGGRAAFAPGVGGFGQIEVGAGGGAGATNESPILLVPGATRLRLGLEPGSELTYAGDGPAARWGRALRLAWRIQRRQVQEDTAVLRWADAAASALEREEHPEVRGALGLAVLMAAVTEPVAPAKVDRALQAIQPDAAAWSWAPDAAAQLVFRAASVAEKAGSPGPGGGVWAGRQALALRRAVAYLERVIDQHPDPLVRRRLALDGMRIAERSGRLDIARSFQETLLERFPESAEAGRARLDPPGRALQVGDPVPDVPLPPLDTESTAIQSKQLAGPATLVDFWATWCTPCVAELPVIRDAYRRYRDRGFDVVSVSYDADRGAVERFREARPMPWRHAFVGVSELTTGEVAGAYGIDALPHAVLVGPDGRILALGEAVRGERLAGTLERVLGPSDGAPAPR